MTEFEATRPDWHQHAACRGQDPNLFFPEKEGRRTVAKAQRFCDRCPVTQQCGDYARTNHEDFGVWGGESARHRVHVRIAALKASFHTCVICGGDFRPIRSTHLTCSDECRDANHYRVQTERRAAAKRARRAGRADAA